MDFPYGRRPTDSHERLLSAIDTLPRREKRVAMLGILGQQSVQQIAVRLKVPEEEVQALWDSARATLRIRLGMGR